ncbi:M48 family metallopeptidase [Acidaminobacter sp. JC074]|uniref:M48 family metallopeptidase n=1 Tax=Acidaminobacter sp. JC074 TaxID=2530199 RepID=UPI001F103A62|nr:M48 family metallopeptidase [Acidaminobacter sp. JC074]MCH4886611.1 M48 family metallopeptidase [Acidaminobacter sp. JC074]
MFVLIIAAILLVFTIDITLSTLNYKNRNQPIPENVKDVYDEEDYKKWHLYTMEVFKLNLISKIINTGVLILFFVVGVFPRIAAFTDNLSENNIIQTLLFLGVYALISYMIGIGFSIYRTFNIEERYGFNKTTLKTFILDQIKGLVLGAIIGGGLLALLLYFYEFTGKMALLYAWIAMAVFTLLINILYTKVFIKLFNKITPLEEGELYDKATQLSKSLGYEIKSIGVMDASKRSSRLNAFFSGFGKFKSIILYDTLLEKCTTDEIISVLAHEIGHSIHKDVFRNFVIALVQTGIFLAILFQILSSNALSLAFGFTQVHTGFSIILFGILLEPISILINMPLSYLSRKAEYRADAVAKKAGYKDAMVSALKVLSRENFSNLTPHPLVVKLTYSHPPTSDRIKNLQ